MLWDPPSPASFTMQKSQIPTTNTKITAAKKEKGNTPKTFACSMLLHWSAVMTEATNHVHGLQPWRHLPHFEMINTSWITQAWLHSQDQFSLVHRAGILVTRQAKLVVSCVWGDGDRAYFFLRNLQLGNSGCSCFFERHCFLQMHFKKPYPVESHLDHVLLNYNLLIDPSKNLIIVKPSPCLLLPLPTPLTN